MCIFPDTEVSLQNSKLFTKLSRKSTGDQASSMSNLNHSDNYSLNHAL